MEKSLNWYEFVITRLIKASGYSAIIFVALIFFFLVREGVPTFLETDLTSLFSIRWYPIEEYYGILPLISGSLIVTLGATLVAVPFGIGTAIYISEIAPRWMREILKPLVELLGGLPSVVLGFLGILLLSPFLRVLLDLPTGLTAFTGSLLLGGIAVPTVVSVAEDALDAVPRAYREGAGSHTLANYLASHLSRRPLGRADRDHARRGTCHRRNDDRDDGDRECAGAGHKTWQLVLPGPHNDRDHRCRNGGGRKWKYALSCPVFHWHGLIPDLTGRKYCRFIGCFSRQETR